MLETSVNSALDLLDYRRRVSAIYTAVRESQGGQAARDQWRAARDSLFATHSQSPIDDQELFTPLPYFDYDDRFRTLGQFRAVRDIERALQNNSEGQTPFTKVGEVGFLLVGNVATLEVLWLNAYGGGLFLPFRDASNGATTYGGGRYLLDTVKGADLGQVGDQIILDFNYAYHPSCVHSTRWSCPLAPEANSLGFAVTAGERLRETPIQ